MLSDRHRWLKLALALVLLAGLGLAYGRAALRLPGGWWACVQDPAGHDGARLVFPLYRVESTTEGGFTMGKVAHGVPVVAPAEPVAVGETVSVAGHFRAADRRVVATEVQHHPLRPYKVGLGILGLLAALVAAPLSFTWRDGRLDTRG